MNADWSCTISSNEFKPTNGELYLVLMHVNLQPAHLVLLVNNRYYSLSANKVDIGRSSMALFSIVEVKHIPCLVIQLSNNFLKSNIEEILAKEFGKYQRISDNKTTCLAPVRSSLEFIYEIGMKSQIVLDLLDVLDSQHIVKEVYGYNLAKGNFILKRYSFKEVIEQIRIIRNRN